MIDLSVLTELAPFDAAFAPTGERHAPLKNRPRLSWTLQRIDTEGPGPGRVVLTILEHRPRSVKAHHYFVQAAAGQQAFRLHNWSGKSYLVNLFGRVLCNCDGFRGHRHCKHALALDDLRADLARHFPETLETP